MTITPQRRPTAPPNRAHDTYSSSGTSTAGETTVYGGGSVNGAETVGGTDCGTDRFSSKSNDTITTSGIDTYLLTQYGTFGNFSFADGSYVNQGGDSFTETTTDLVKHATYSGTDTGNARDQGQSTAWAPTPPTATATPDRSRSPATTATPPAAPAATARRLAPAKAIRSTRPGSLRRQPQPEQRLLQFLRPRYLVVPG